MSATPVKCPQCGKPTVYAESNPFRPFCSERCQLLDLGKWAAGQHVIPGEDAKAGTEVNENPTESAEEDELPTHEQMH